MIDPHSTVSKLNMPWYKICGVIDEYSQRVAIRILVDQLIMESENRTIVPCRETSHHMAQRKLDTGL